MKTGGALLIIAAGLIALWIVITGRLAQLQQAWNTLNGQAPAASTPGGITLPQLPGLTLPGSIPASYGSSALSIPSIAL